MRGLFIFDTGIGRCGIAWDEQAILAASLPEQDDEAILRRLARRAPGAVPMAPPAWIDEAVAGIQGLMRGEPRDLLELPLAVATIEPFARAVYDVTRRIPPGQTLTYGEVAAKAGEPGAAQAVGQALGANPFPPIIPCHRVLSADGAMHGFSAHGGVETKRRMLRIEGAIAQFSLFE